ncbi:MAG: GTPase [Deltaproteobacteria bacterium]|nr:GTPase [Deltaproteobacteria bacterium]
MSLPIIAIVGRPNVGKSRLFNRLTGGGFKALVDDQPGVTRDRHYGFGDWRGQQFIVVDTGGLIPGAEDPLNKKVWGQAFLAIQEADIIICLLDGMSGLNPVDEVLVQELRKIDKPVFYAVNKIDEATHENNVVDFTRLGLDPLIPVSAEHGRGVSDLLEGIYTEISQGVRHLMRSQAPRAFGWPLSGGRMSANRPLSTASRGKRGSWCMKRPVPRAMPLMW